MKKFVGIFIRTRISASEGCGDMMILRIKPRAAIQAGLPATIGDIASVMCDARLSVNDLIVPMPKEPGIWLVDAGSVMNVIYGEYPHEKITVLGHLEQMSSPLVAHNRLQHGHSARYCSERHPVFVH